MVEHDEPAECADPCFLALTRPAMFMGVPMEAFALNGIGTTAFYLVMGHIKYAVVGVVLHFVFRALVWEDHNRFNLIAAWLATRGLQKNRMYWQGSSTSPSRLLTSYSTSDDTHV
jgi:type IV secretion system protein VirB3